MSRRTDRISWGLGLIVAVVFLAGIVHVFLMRFEKGDVYPAYSSLRSDPVGARALYDSLELCEGIAVSRNHAPPANTAADADTVLLFLGEPVMEEARIPGDTIARINGLVRRGTRVVVTLMPRNRPAKDEDEEIEDGKDDKVDEVKDEVEEEEEKDKVCEKCGKVHDEDDEEARDGMIFGKWWSVGFDDLPVTEEAVAVRSDDDPAAGLPARISCHTSVFFDELDEDWKTVYERDGRAVIVERPLGKGTLVLSALSYFVSNEALKEERHPDLLSWLVGDKAHVVFDEYHHGIVRRRGVAALAWQYGLQWAAAALLLLAVLFVWQRTVPPFPRVTDGTAPAPDNVAAGRISAAGLQNLLHRNIGRGDLIDACFAEWRRSAGRTATGVQRTRIQALVHAERNRPTGTHDVVNTYNQIAETLAKDTTREEHT